jgi:hypothetical protein
MSALGHNRTFGDVGSMSALPPKADIDQRSVNVRLVPKADSCTAAKALPIFEQLGVSSGNFS